ncbi:hypothetical protein XH93_07130 [Bradyrhizobium sp. CCBAU 51753]|nr:hypothetical protein XH93_07130 [Bradyrhizobium sp. CCBAU 51753]
MLGSDRDCDTAQGETLAIAMIAATLPMAARRLGIVAMSTSDGCMIVSDCLAVPNRTQDIGDRSARAVRR